MSIGENDLFKVQIKLTNIGEPAYEPSFFLVVPETMQYAGSTPIYPVSIKKKSLKIDLVEVVIMNGFCNFGVSLFHKISCRCNRNRKYLSNSTILDYWN